MPVLYVDVLLGINLFMNYFLLLACSKFLGLPVQRKRMLGSACIGSVYSLCILLPEIHPVLSLLMKLLLSFIMTRLAWTWQGWRVFAKEICLFYLTSFAFDGFMLALWYVFQAQGLVLRNSVLYFSVSPILFLLFTVLSYGCIRLLQRFTGKENEKNKFCQLEIHWGNFSLQCKGKIDTGNALTEPFSGYPVIVLDREKAPPLENYPEKTRLIPFSTINGTGMLAAFRPDLLILTSGSTHRKCTDVYIAVSQAPISSGEFSALVNPQIFF